MSTSVNLHFQSPDEALRYLSAIINLCVPDDRKNLRSLSAKFGWNMTLLLTAFTGETLDNPKIT